MADTVSVPIRRDLFARLQARSEPLVDTIDSVIERLLTTAEEEKSPSARPAFRTLARGQRLQVGLRLRAAFQGKTFDAVVTDRGIEFAGLTYDSPSAAARAVKESVGVATQAAHSNGWKFWDYETGFGFYDELEKLRRPERPPLAFVGIGNSGRSDISALTSEGTPEPPPWR